MKYFSLAAVHRDAGWFLNPLTGNLHQTSARDLRHFQTDDLPSKIVSALAYCDHPYRLQPPDFNDSCHSTEAQLSRLKKTYDRIVFFEKYHLLASHPILPAVSTHVRKLAAGISGYGKIGPFSEDRQSRLFESDISGGEMLSGVQSIWRSVDWGGFASYLSSCMDY